jgi:eukaryotic-like serine/threonine-protein kinase
VKLTLTVVAGPHLGKQFSFDSRDTFLVGRGDDAHLKLSNDDPYFSRRHFVVEINPPRCRVLDLRSRNGTLVNGNRVESTELKNGDQISGGNTVFRVSLSDPIAQEEPTLVQPTAVLDDPNRTLELPASRATAFQGYELGREIGRGGMGIVYQAVRLSDNTKVAIKTITPTAGVSQKQINLFVRECQILSQLSHPNIVKFLEVGEVDGTVYLVMEFIQGSDVRKILDKQGPLSIKTAVRLICQLATGLEHAHDRGFVHRDIKPSNILISGQKGQRLAKLVDFGLARAYESSKLSGLTMQGEVGGTPAFMAPEQVTHYRDVKPAADQYSTAATLYNLLTAKFPHELPNDIVLQLIHLVSQKPIAIQQRRADISNGLSSVIHKALSTDPKHRFRDIQQFRKALLEFT